MWNACKLTYLDSKLAHLLVLGLMQIKWSFSLLFVLAVISRKTFSE